MVVMTTARVKPWLSTTKTIELHLRSTGMVYIGGEYQYVAHAFKQSQKATKQVYFYTVITRTSFSVQFYGICVRKNGCSEWKPWMQCQNGIGLQPFDDVSDLLTSCRFRSYICTPWSSRAVAFSLLTALGATSERLGPRGRWHSCRCGKLSLNPVSQSRTMNFNFC